MHLSSFPSLDFVFLLFIFIGLAHPRRKRLLSSWQILISLGMRALIVAPFPTQLSGASLETTQCVRKGVLRVLSCLSFLLVFRVLGGRLKPPQRSHSQNRVADLQKKDLRGTVPERSTLCALSPGTAPSQEVPSCQSTSFSCVQISVPFVSSSKRCLAASRSVLQPRWISSFMFYRLSVQPENHTICADPGKLSVWPPCSNVSPLCFTRSHGFFDRGFVSL
jgi:hypothetical protein